MTAPSEDSDEPGHPLCAQWVAKGPIFLHADSEDSDQTGSESSLAHMPFCWFCHVAANIVYGVVVRGVLKRQIKKKWQIDETYGEEKCRFREFIFIVH